MTHPLALLNWAKKGNSIQIQDLVKVPVQDQDQNLLSFYQLLFYYDFKMHFISLCARWYTVGLSLCGPSWLLWSLQQVLDDEPPISLRFEAAVVPHLQDGDGDDVARVVLCSASVGWMGQVEEGWSA